jgi:hypothetical protein
MPRIDAQESIPPHTRERLPFQLEAVGVAPGRFPCTAQLAKHETQDEHTSQDSFSTYTLQVSPPAQLQMDKSIWGEACETFAMLQIKVLCTQQHLITDLQGLLNTILVCKRFLSLLSRNQTFACKAERRLQTLNESSRRWVHDFNNLTSWSPRMMAVSQLKRGRTDGLVNRCIMGKLCM